MRRTHINTTVLAAFKRFESEGVQLTRNGENNPARKRERTDLRHRQTLARSSPLLAAVGAVTYLATLCTCCGEVMPFPNGPPNVHDVPR